MSMYIICILNELKIFALFVVHSVCAVEILVVVVVVVVFVVVILVVSVVIVALIVAVFIFVPVIIVLTGTSFKFLSIFSSSIDYNNSAL